MRDESSRPAKAAVLKRKNSPAVEIQERDVLSSATPNAMRLNRFIAASGVTSRRKADELIAGGLVRVNGKTVLEMGVTINPHQDQVVVDGRVVSIPTRQMYLVMNKPKDYITTAKDEKERKTVFDLISTYDRVHNVGRLDRNTTGVLLFTNDGELTNRLTHPSYQIAREYHATLDKPLTHADAKKIAEGGLDIGDGDVTGPAEVSIADRDPKDVILTITEGKNREVRRIFETLGYDVEKLDRLSFAGITHKGMTRSEVRPLTRQEVRHLKKLVGLDSEEL
jgi:23S rRNA pseudouridine2605 synthase